MMSSGIFKLSLVTSVIGLTLRGDDMNVCVQQNGHTSIFDLSNEMQAADLCNQHCDLCECVPEDGPWHDAITGDNAYGFAGGILLSIGLLPQVIHMIERKSGKDISYNFLALYIIALSLLLAYGYLLELWAFFAPVSLQLAMNLVMLVLKYYYSLNEEDDASAKSKDDPSNDKARRRARSFSIFSIPSPTSNTDKTDSEGSQEMAATEGTAKC